MKKVVGILLIIVMILQTAIVLAVSREDLENQQEETQTNIKETEKTIEEIQAQKSDAL